MQKFQQFQKAYNDAVATINDFLVNDSAADMRELVRWMMTTDANPYSYLPHYWAGSTGTAESFASLLHHIHHAVYDDGYVTFVSVNGEPRITFVYRFEDNFRDLVLNAGEKEFEQRPILGRVNPITVEVLDIEPNEFGAVYDQWHAQDLRRCFTIDAAMQGTEWAANHYRKYQLWQDSWITECAEKIKQHRAMRKRAFG